MSREIPSVSIIGSRGKMGRALAHLMEGEFASRVRLHVPIHSKSPDEDWVDALASETWVDFSLPAGVLGIHAAISAALRAQPSARLPALVIGTTGHDARERALIEDLASKTLVLQASNFSIGILVLKKTLEFASSLLKNSGFKPVMLEMHHIHKKDAPSGTALSLAASTQGLTAERIHSIRAGEVVGDHSITFHGSGEQLTFSHHAMNREIFARGALEAALWLSEKRALIPSSAGHVTLDDFFEEKYSCLTPSK